MSRALTLLLIASVALAAAEIADAQQVPAAAAAPTKDSTRMTTVTYISGTSVYAAAGRLDGLSEGMVIEVLRAGTVIARAKVTFLASHSSSSEVQSSASTPVVGDSVRYHPSISVALAIAHDSTVAPPIARATSAPWRRPIRGHLGFRYLSVSQPSLPAGAATLNQPSADIRLEGTHLAGGQLGFTIDGRARTTIGPRDSTVSALDRHMQLYQASLSLGQVGSGARISVGRQYSPALASAGLFDGVTAELNGSLLGIGLFHATQPDVTTMAFSTHIRETGAYVQMHSRPEWTVPWSLTLGGVASRDSGQLNRQFGFGQLTLSSQVMTLYAMQEVDFNSGWKRTTGEPAVTPTSTFAAVSIRPSDALSFNAGVDNRRNVMLYRDYVNAVTAFDDAFRQGVWVGASLYFLHAVRLGGDARFSKGGEAGKADQVTGSLSIGPVLPKHLDFRMRSTRYTTDRSTGWLHAWTAGVDPVDVLHLELNGGVRTQQSPTASATPTAFTPINALSNGGWFGASADLSIGRWWYVLVSATRDKVGADDTRVMYCSLMLRF